MRSLRTLLAEPPTWLRFVVMQLWEPVLLAAAFIIFAWPGLLLLVTVLIARLVLETRRERNSVRQRLAREYAAGWSDERLTQVLARLGRTDLLVLRPAGRHTRGLRIFGGSPAYLVASEAAVNVYDDGDPATTARRLEAVLAHELCHLDGRHATFVTVAVIGAFAITLMLSGVALVLALSRAPWLLAAALIFVLAAPYLVALAGLALQRSCEFVADRAAAQRVGAAVLRDCLHREWHAEQLEDEAQAIVTYMIDHHLPLARQAPLLRAGFARDIAALEEAVDNARGQLDAESPGWSQLEPSANQGLRGLWSRLVRLWGQLNSDHPPLTTRIKRLAS